MIVSGGDSYISIVHISVKYLRNCQFCKQWDTDEFAALSARSDSLTAQKFFRKILPHTVPGREGKL